MNKYAAHREGEFSTVEGALTKVGLSPDAIAFAIQNSKINLSPAVCVPINDDYGALVTKEGDHFVLWRGFYGARGTEEHVRGTIKQFRALGVTGGWAIFEWVPPASMARN